MPWALTKQGEVLSWVPIRIAIDSPPTAMIFTNFGRTHGVCLRLLPGVRKGQHSISWLYGYGYSKDYQ
jgi:hypothetical protein